MKEEVAGLIVVDDGGSNTVVVTRNVIEIFPSVKGIYGNRTLTQVTSKHDFIVEYKNEKYVLGTLSKFDCEYPLQIFSKSKQHDFFDLSVLTAIHQYGYSSNYLVVSVPVKMHTEEEKQGRIRRLRGSHTLTVNGVTKTFLVADVKVSAESATAYFVDKPSGMTRFLDIGSRTVNFSTSLCIDGNCRMIDTGSGTFFDKGLEALGEGFNAKALADYTCGQLLAKWNSDDVVYLLGGGALNEELVQHIKFYFPNLQVMDDPITASARGMFNLGVIGYGMD